MADLPPTHHIEDEGDVVRFPEQDYVSERTGPMEAWQYTDPCDESCHHPVHALNTPRGRRHLTWLIPNSFLPQPLETTA